MKKLLENFDEVIILIGSCENSYVYDWNNPLSTGERVEMIRTSFNKKDLSKLILVPLRDLDNDSFWRDAVINYVPEFEAVYSNNQIVINLFKDYEYTPPINNFFYAPDTIYRKPHKIEILTGFYNLEKYNGTKIRALISNGDETWKKLVPKNTIRLIEELRIDRRLRRPRK